MAQLPRVVVVGPAPAGAAALWALTDCGLPATGLLSGPPSARDERYLAERYLAERSLAGRVVWLPAGSTVAAAPLDPTGWPWSIDVVDEIGEIVTRATADAVALVPPGPAEPAPALSGLALGEPRTLFGSVFHPDRDGVYQLTGADELPNPSGARFPGARLPGRPAPGRPAPDGHDPDGGLLEARARWLGEYLRGRYLLPPRSAMVGAGGIAAGHRRLGRFGRIDPARWLLAESRRGRARAAGAGYPLPLPAREGASAHPPTP